MRLVPLLALLLTACANLSGEPRIVSTRLPATSTPPPPTLAPVDDQGFPAQPPDLANGARLYAENCAACHGEDGRGDGPVTLENPDVQPGDFRDPASPRAQSPHEWFSKITLGDIGNLMPPWGNLLTEQERWDVALYTYTLHYTGEQLVAGERVFQECAECHGPEGRGDGPEAPMLALPVKNLTDRQKMVSLSDASIFRLVTQGLDEVMPSYDGLSEEYRWAVVAYTRTLSLSDVPALTQPDATTTPETPLTGSLTALTGTALLLQIHAAGDALEVVQALRIRNLSESAAFSQQIPLPDGGTGALALTLPEGAALNSATGIGTITPDGQTVYIVDPLPPMSESLFVLSYTLPYTVGEPVSVPLDIVIAGQVRVLVRPLEMRARAEMLLSLGEQVLGDELYNAYGDQLALQAGTSLTFTLTGTPDAAPIEPPRTTPLTPPGLVVIPILAPLLVLIVAAVAVGIVVLILRSRGREGESRIGVLARQIAELDAAHERGALNHDLWHRQRGALKDELSALIGGETNDDD